VIPPSSILARIPAEPPIGGPVWTWVVPALLFGVSLVATWRLYRHFADRG
jgi:hypothetical protein